MSLIAGVNKQLYLNKFETANIIFVDTKQLLLTMIRKIAFQYNTKVNLNIDFENVKNGPLSIGQFNLSNSNDVYIIDFTKLPVFDINDGLKNILTSMHITKIFFCAESSYNTLIKFYNIQPKNLICLHFF